MEELKTFSEILESNEGKEILALGDKIKKLDKSNEKRTLLVILTSIVSMTLLGYYALGMTGAVIFLAITVIASFWLFYSSKKNVLLKYLAFYRSRVPKLIAMAEGVEVKAEEIPETELVSQLSDKGKLCYRMCHRYGDIYIGFAKFMVGGEPILQGVVYSADGDGDISDSFKNLLDSEFEEYTIKNDNGKTVLFIPWVEDYLNGRVEMKDDLTFPALVRQYDYYLLGKAFASEIKGIKTEYNTIFHEVR